MGTMWDNVGQCGSSRQNNQCKVKRPLMGTISSVNIIFDVDFDVNVVADVGADANKLHGRQSETESGCADIFSPFQIQLILTLDQSQNN